MVIKSIEKFPNLYDIYSRVEEYLPTAGKYAVISYICSNTINLPFTRAVSLWICGIMGIGKGFLDSYRGKNVEFIDRATVRGFEELMIKQSKVDLFNNKIHIYRDLNSALGTQSRTVQGLWLNFYNSYLDYGEWKESTMYSKVQFPKGKVCLITAMTPSLYKLLRRRFPEVTFWDRGMFLTMEYKKEEQVKKDEQINKGIELEKELNISFELEPFKKIDFNIDKYKKEIDYWSKMLHLGRKPFQYNKDKELILLSTWSRSRTQLLIFLQSLCNIERLDDLNDDILDFMNEIIWDLHNPAEDTEIMRNIFHNSYWNDDRPIGIKGARYYSIYEEFLKRNGYLL